jgi:TIR domain
MDEVIRTAAIRVFVSYRREDSRHVAGRLFDHLAERFGTDNVFMDVDSIEPGLDFGIAIERAVAECDVLLALIGQAWLSTVDEQGRRRLDDPDDLVVLEVRSALDRDIRVIPVLIDGAMAPRRSELPEVLAPLARRNAVRLYHETFRIGAGALMDVLNRAAGPAAPVPPPTRADATVPQAGQPEPGPKEPGQAETNEPRRNERQQRPAGQTGLREEPTLPDWRPPGDAQRRYESPVVQPSIERLVRPAVMNPPRQPDKGVERSIFQRILDAPLLPRALSRRARYVVASAVLVSVVVVGGMWLAGMWAQQQYYIGADGDRVAIFQGVRGEVLGVRLQHVSEQTDLALLDLPESERIQVADGIISTDGLNGAHALVDKLRDRMLPECPAARVTPTPVPSATLTPGLTCRAVG